MQLVGSTWTVRRLWDRTLDRYPDTGRRYFNLGIVVLAAIVLYYEFYVPAAVTPSIIADFGMTWPFFVYVIVVGNLVGAFASLIAGLSDRWGRSNLVTYGLLVTALVVLLGLPNAPNLWVYAALYCLLGFVEGIILVTTLALVRDFSPQLGRGSATGLWTMGPVLASLTVALVSSHTLGHLHAWQDQFIICGIVGLVMFAIALVGLRELSPQIRAQLMVRVRDRQLVEARASGIDVEERSKRPWRQMLRLDIVGPSLGIGFFLVVYYTLIAFMVVYMATTFRYTEQRANALGNWVWAFDAGALVLVGVLSDKLRVRKPLMIIGIAGTIVATVLFVAAHEPSRHGLLHVRLDPEPAGRVPCVRLRPMAGGVHRDGREAQPGSRCHRPRGVGVDSPPGRRRIAVRPHLRRDDHDATGRARVTSTSTGRPVPNRGGSAQRHRSRHPGAAGCRSVERRGHQHRRDRDLPGAPCELRGGAAGSGGDQPDPAGRSERPGELWTAGATSRRNVAGRVASLVVDLRRGRGAAASVRLRHEGSVEPAAGTCGRE